MEIIIDKEEINKCVEWLDYCYNYITRHDKIIYKKYEDFINQSRLYKYKLQLYKHFDPQTFIDLNEWFCAFTFGLENFNFDEIMPETAQEILNFSTQICWTYGYDIPDEKKDKLIYKIV